MKFEVIDLLNFFVICVVIVMKVLCLIRDVIYKWLLFVKRLVMVLKYFLKNIYLLVCVNMKVKFWEY